MSLRGYLVSFGCICYSTEIVPHFKGCFASVVGYQNMSQIGLLKGVCSVFCWLGGV